MASPMPTNPLLGPIYHHTTADINRLSDFDPAKASASSVWGPGLYATLGQGTWNPGHLQGGKTLSGYVKGDVIDLSKPLPREDQERLSKFIGRDVETVPLLSLEKRYGSVAAGLKAAGYSAALHEGPGGTGSHVVVFDPADIVEGKGMASPMPSMANALMQPTQGPGRFGPAAAPAPVGNLRLPPANALVAPSAAPPMPAPGPMMPGVQPPAIHPDFMPQPVPETERISARVPVPKADFPEKHHKELHDKVLGEHFDDSGAASAIRDTYAILRKTRPHLHPRHVLEAARDAWFAHEHGFMTPQMVGQAVGNIAEQRHNAMGGMHPSDTEEAPNE